MKHLIESVEKALGNGNWHAALTLSLTLPDIAGKVEYPNETGSRKRYSDWFNVYLKPQFSFNITGTEEVFLSGNDCYALRCVFLHEGNVEIDGQRAQEFLESFYFVEPSDNALDYMHNNIINNKLQLQVDLFCMQILKAIKQWIEDIKGEQEKESRLLGMMKLLTLNETKKML